MRRSKILPSLLIFLVATLVLLELGIRLAYDYSLRNAARFPMLYERVYWADVPPWVGYMSIFTTDPEVGLWMKSNVIRSYINLFGPIGDLRDVAPMFTRLHPTIAEWARERPVWELRTNALGIRNGDIQSPKPPTAFRVVALGDSWTVGVNLGVEQTYAQRLAARLREGLPAGQIEVVNYGVIGGRAAAGRRLIERVLSLDPDLIVVAYAQNDEESVRLGTPEPTPDVTFSARLWLQCRSVLDHLESLKLLRHLWTRNPEAIDASLQLGLTQSSHAGENERQPGCPNPRAAETPYRRDLMSLVTTALARHVDTVLLYANVPEAPSHCTLAILSELARTYHVPLVDASSLLATKRAELATEAERRKDIVPPPAEARRGLFGAATVVFRVDMSNLPGMPHIVGNLPSLGSFRPNVVAMFDDGTHGDQRARDGIWSLAIDLKGFARIVYLYTNGGEPGSWTGLENYQPRVYTVTPEDPRRIVYTSIAEFGRMPLRSDPGHPDALGADLIAESLARTIRARPAWQAYAATHHAQ